MGNSVWVCQFILVLLFILPHHQLVYSIPSSPPYNHSCHHDQSLALLQFKQMFRINSSASYGCGFSGQPKTMSWKRDTDCCTWDGVTCDGLTGHVIELDLSCSQLQGYIPSNTTTLSKLSHLKRLNFAFNNFYPSRISHQFLCQFATTLTHLNLSFSRFSGQISSEISHMSKLVSLDLSDNFDSQLGSHNLRMLLQNLTQLKQLSLSGINISSTVPLNLSSSLTSLDLSHTGLYGKLPGAIFYLPILVKLDLHDNPGLTGPFPEVNVSARSSSSSLMWLDLLYTSLHGELPDSIGYFKSLNRLDLSHTSLHGELPDSIGYFKSLNHLDLSGTSLHGELPDSIGNLKSLKELRLGDCKFSGSIPRSLRNLTQLAHLDIRGNNFSGEIANNFTQIFRLIANLTQLLWLDLSDNSLSGPLPSNIVGFPKLDYLNLGHNSFTGTIPSWLFALPSLTALNLYSNRFTGKIPEIQSKSLLSIDLSDNNNLHGPIPQSCSKLVNLIYLSLSVSGNNFSDPMDLNMFSNFTNLEVFNISCNGLSVISTNTKINATFPHLSYLRLASCKMKEFPHLFKDSPSLQTLDLSNNQIHGQLSNWPLSMWPDSLLQLNLRSNLLQGSLPSPICNFSSLYVLDLSNNSFSGTIPKCLGNFSANLFALDLRNNGFLGTIPTTLCAKGNILQTLNLHGNQLEGILPRSLANCKQLHVLDLGNNKINDTFPHWLGTLPRLQVLVLRYNRFHGPINSTTKTKLPFPKLRIIDLSNNQFIGFLPSKYFRYFKAMMNVRETEMEEKYITIDLSVGYYDEVTVVMKGLQYDMVKIQNIFTTIDLSSNKFEGEIPNFIGNLNSLRVLNLSHNSLAGHVPSTLGNISVLESLDLSSNQLVGEIPQQLTCLTFLEFLNLSKNHLVGPIPQGKQFHTFENDSYIGNSALCGSPLLKKCGDDETPKSPVFQQEEDSNFWSGFTWKVVLMGYGFGTIFGMVMGLLMFLTGKPKWFTEIVGKGQHKKVKRTMKGGQRRHGRRN